MKILNKDDLRAILPHSGNALKIDQVHYNPYKSDEIIAVKKVSYADLDLVGHFPDNPIYPGHCIDECFNLAAAALIALKGQNSNGKLPIIRGKDAVKYSDLVVPGDTIIFTVILKKNRNNMMYVFDGRAVNQHGKEVARIDGIKGVAIKI